MRTYQNERIWIRFVYEVDFEENTTIARYLVQDKATGERQEIVGITVKNPKDKDNRVIGKAIAYYKATEVLRRVVDEETFDAITNMVLNYYSRVDKILPKLIKDGYISNYNQLIAI